MPALKSAEKRMRQDVKRKLNNRIRKTRMNTTERALNEAIAAGNKEEATIALAKCFSVLDKAAKVGTIHSNKADRKKARLAARLSKLA